jgi:DNA polymerase-3 subunit alpha
LDNYTVYHIHSDLSNLTVSSGADSITKYSQYLDKAEQLGMGAIAFSEHGSVLNHVNKKRDIEERGMKYIHANEIYLTKGIVDVNGEPLRERDNYHYMLMAKNYDGYLELNKLTSQSFKKEDGHFYFNPRITFDELKNTSDNILMTSACIASPIYRLYQESLNGNKNSERELDDLLNFMGDNKHRMFFEIQAHNHPKQIEFNQLLLRLSRDLDIPLIGGTDTHALNKEHAEARSLFIKSKGIDYGDEDSFDLTFKSYEEFVKMFEEQNALPRNIYLEAIHNTNVMADMVEPFTLDDSPKYPKLYDKPIEVFKEKINEGTIERGINKLPKDEKKVYFDRIKEEFKTYEKLEAVDYMLLQKHIIDWSNENGIKHGYGRGSCCGSLIAYLLGITEMDSVKHELNFFR